MILSRSCTRVPSMELAIHNEIFCPIVEETVYHPLEDWFAMD
jgi:hypothetical protein